MVIGTFDLIVALAGPETLAHIAENSGLSLDELKARVCAVAEEVPRPIATPHSAPAPPPVHDRSLLRSWAGEWVAEVRQLQMNLQQIENEAAVAPLLARRSVSPKRLRAPAPSQADIDLMLQAAMRGPDHGNLLPWRVVEFRAEQREALALLFEQEKLRRDPLVSAADLRRAREHATSAPALLAFVVAPQARSKVPVREQWLAAGAALGNLLNAAHQLNFGAIMLSGERCFDAVLAEQLGVQPDEFLAGFVSLGTVDQVPPKKKHALPAQVWSCWWPRPVPPEPAADAQRPADEGRAG